MNIVWVLFLHWLGDFVFQSDWMAKNKSKSNEVLLIHISAYSLPLFLIGWKFALINAGLHCVTDYFTSRWTSKLWAAGNVHWFFVVIGLDQFIHTSCLILTFNLLKGVS